MSVESKSNRQVVDLIVNTTDQRNCLQLYFYCTSLYSFISIKLYSTHFAYTHGDTGIFYNANLNILSVDILCCPLHIDYIAVQCRKVN